MSVSAATPWRILQLADSAFPTGGFAHSGGLEAAMHLGEARTAARLSSYLQAYMWNVGHASLPFAAAAHDEPRDVWALDAQADAALLSHVANRASRTQGRTFLGTCARVFDEPALEALAARARARAVPAHLAPVFGAALAALGVERRETLALYVHLALRGVVSAAVRLGIVGPHEAQRLQGSLGGTLEGLLRACERLQPRDVATVTPLHDIMGATHDSLYSRLFQS